MMIHNFFDLIKSTFEKKHLINASKEKTGVVWFSEMSAEFVCFFFSTFRKHSFTGSEKRVSKSWVPSRGFHVNYKIEYKCRKVHLFRRISLINVFVMG